MKKIICSKVETLVQSDLDKVVGGGSWSDRANQAACTTLGGGSNCGGCSSKAQSVHDAVSKSSTSSKNYTGGCNVRSGSSSSSSHSSRVICTHFYKKGMLPGDIWRADLEFTSKHLSTTTVKGYHYWAVPYVALMRKSAFFEKVMFPLAKYRAYELAYQMNIRQKGSLRGKLIRLVCEPVCYTIGLFCEQKEWKQLWVAE